MVHQGLHQVMLRHPASVLLRSVSPVKLLSLSELSFCIYKMPLRLLSKLSERIHNKHSAQHWHSAKASDAAAAVIATYGDHGQLLEAVDVGGMAVLSGKLPGRGSWTVGARRVPENIFPTLCLNRQVRRGAGRQWGMPGPFGCLASGSFMDCSGKRADAIAGKGHSWVCDSRQKYPEQKCSPLGSGQPWASVCRWSRSPWSRSFQAELVRK